ncbi:hypothetical protein CYMTET_19775 [Cymbomonas tetramitiformis]|uniref:phosphoglycerate mutase (2,3-diphosphoglycerate-independent) n=1 Tax=Cymbomonas tetramitiformis TaxID=36881 RepID=A0AAE0G5B5_9CHLO|nr:hypothetical protein CYMTET_19775 [Cymbomonas tetramitiformis]|eukprot:gene19477-23286_t
MGKGGAEPGDFALTESGVVPTKKPVLVCVLDGWGVNPITDEWNAVHCAETPTYDALTKVEGRFTTVAAHGPAVGLPTWDDMGNSEVGHNALGSGQLIAQGARLVDGALADKSIFTEEGWNYIKPAFASNTVHLIALLSSGGVHSRFDQIEGIMRGAAKDGAKKIRMHVLLDGRDVPDGSSIQYMTDLEKVLSELRAAGCDAQVASGGGRMHMTMDRYEADWAMVKRGWDAHALGEAPHKFKDPVEAVKSLREIKPNDQYLEAFVIVDDSGSPVGAINDGDAVALLNFRADRMVEISKAFEYEDFKEFDRKRWPKTLFVGIMQYDGDLKLPAKYLVPPPSIVKTIGEYMAKNGLKTFACSETQKFGHVTFFWNGNRSGYFDEALETYLEIPSDNVPFNEAPLMKAAEITAAGVEALKSAKYDQVRVNFANPDMVGHTGNMEATTEACTFVDQCLKKLLDTVEELGGVFLVTADHGNADDMVQRNKKDKKPVTIDGVIQALTSHTLAPVPVMIGGPGLPASVKFNTAVEKPGLSNVTGTIMNLMGYNSPSCWEPSLI